VPTARPAPYTSLVAESDSTSEMESPDMIVDDDVDPRRGFLDRFD
jgi:hypothetical protein